MNNRLIALTLSTLYTTTCTLGLTVLITAQTRQHVWAQTPLEPTDSSWPELLRLLERNPQTQPSPTQPGTQQTPNFQLDPRFDLNPTFQSQKYNLGPGDQILVEVERFPDLTAAHTITPEGVIVMPLLSVVPVQGLTLEQVQEKIQAQLNQYIINPVVKLSLVTRRPVQVTVTGEVARPGFYPLPSPQISAALLQASGTTAAADLRAIEIRSTLATGEVISQSVDILTPLQRGSIFPDIRLQDGDVIVVPPQTLGGYNESDILVSKSYSLAAPAVPIQITITGQVAKPGFYTLAPGNGRISAALLTAGGTTPTADLRSIQVRRPAANGESTEQRIDLYTPLIRSEAIPDVPLQDGDAIIVPELSRADQASYNRSLIASSTLAKPQITVRVLSYARGNLITLALPNGSTFVDALNGVPVTVANLDKIALIRFDPEQGQAITQQLNGKAAILGDLSQNVLLEDHDVLVIGRSLIAQISYVLNTFTQPFRDTLGFILFFDQLRQGVENLFGPGDSDNQR